MIHAHMPRFHTRALLPVLWAFIVAAAGGCSSPLRSTELTCEYQTTPLAIEDAAPRLSWVIASDRRGTLVTAYRVLVASSPQLLAQDQGDLWDSGRVDSATTTHIAYRGKSLASRQVCWWKVTSWDNTGRQSPWSEPARWEMGLLQPADWSAAWIDARPQTKPVEIIRASYGPADGTRTRDVTAAVSIMAARGEAIAATNEALGGDPAYGTLKQLRIQFRAAGTVQNITVDEKQTVTLAPAPLPLLRKTFDVDKTVVRARLYATALGVYELSLNGQRVGDHELAPGWTDYARRVQYQVFDVTSQLSSGRNALGAVVAPGWFSGRAGLFHARAFYGTAPALRMQLEITYSDGSTARIISDDTWRRTDGPTLSADMMDGEVFDARLAISGWDKPTFDDRTWQRVTTRAESRNLVSQQDHPVRVLAQLPAKTVTEPKPGRWTFDVGQNMVGVPAIRLAAPAGTVITIRSGEILNPDGTIYTTNLRGAAATDTYIARGSTPDAPETWQPRFTFHGFRYVELTGLPTGSPPTASAVTGIVLGSDLPVTGTFASSDARLNQLQSNIVWGLRGNYLSVPTDCPQRDERMGWMADAQVFAPTAAFNANVAPFMTKWMTDVVDAQRADGAHSDVAPVMKGLTYGTPAWADAGTIVPWTIYQQYGDTRILERNIDSMILWVEWCRTHSTGLIRDRDRGNDYGDWLAIGADTPKDLIGTAYFAHSTDLLARSLTVLGRKTEADKYRQLFAEIRTAFIARFIKPDGLITGNTQCGYILALRFNLLPDALRENAARRLLADIQNRGWHLSTGFVGVSHLLPTLDAAGHSEAAVRLLMQDTFPSWLFSVRHGATTIWERWDGWTPATGPHPDHGMNSSNHYSLGSCGQWLFEGLGGIRLDPDHPGFSHFLIRPQITGTMPLTWVRTRFRSVRGDITSNWSLDGDWLTLNVSIPANTSATLTIPVRDGGELTESGTAVRAEASAIDGVRLRRRGSGTADVALGSGNYTFRARRPAATSGNPVIAGWYADPEAAVFAGKYWIYPTTSSRYDDQLAFDAFSSPDLASWTKHADVLAPRSISWAKRAVWAPSVIERDGRYFMFFSANDIQKNGEPGGIGVAVSNSPSGPFTDHLGKPLVDAFHHGAQPIDPFVFRDHDGRHYLIYGGWRHCNIARLKPDFTGFEPFADGSTFKEITPTGYVEGPFMLRRGGKYYFMWSEGGWGGPDYRVAYAVADSPTGPFTRVGTILSQDPTVATGAGHHSVVQLIGSDEYAIVYHRRPLGLTDANHRVVCIDRLTFDDQGRIEPVRITFQGVAPAR